MEEFRSNSCGDGRMEFDNYNRFGKPYSSNSIQNGEQLRSYSANSYAISQIPNSNRELKMGKIANGSISSSSSKAVWCFSDPELQRKKRVASYKAYTVEGKLKRSFSRSFRWLKDKYTHMVHGW